MRSLEIYNENRAIREVEFWNQKISGAYGKFCTWFAAQDGTTLDEMGWYNFVETKVFPKQPNTRIGFMCSKTPKGIMLNTITTVGLQKFKPSIFSARLELGTDKTRMYTEIVTGYIGEKHIPEYEPHSFDAVGVISGIETAREALNAGDVAAYSSRRQALDVAHAFRLLGRDSTEAIRTIIDPSSATDQQMATRLFQMSSNF